jgi:hypothetical protein
MMQFKIRYRTGQVQTLEADSYARAGDRYGFFRDGEEIHSVQADLVQTVGLADISNPELALPQVETSDAQRSRRGHSFS